jgi:hypothetical protein
LLGLHLRALHLRLRPRLGTLHLALSLHLLLAHCLRTLLLSLGLLLTNGLLPLHRLHLLAPGLCRCRGLCLLTALLHRSVLCWFGAALGGLRLHPLLAALQCLLLLLLTPGFSGGLRLLLLAACFPLTLRHGIPLPFGLSASRLFACSFLLGSTSLLLTANLRRSRLGFLPAFRAFRFVGLAGFVLHAAGLSLLALALAELLLDLSRASSLLLFLAELFLLRATGRFRRRGRSRCRAIHFCHAAGLLLAVPVATGSIRRIAPVERFQGRTLAGGDAGLFPALPAIFVASWSAGFPIVRFGCLGTRYDRWVHGLLDLRGAFDSLRTTRALVPVILPVPISTTSCHDGRRGVWIRFLRYRFQFRGLDCPCGRGVGP